MKMAPISCHLVDLCRIRIQDPKSTAPRRIFIRKEFEIQTFPKGRSGVLKVEFLRQNPERFSDNGFWK